MRERGGVRKRRRGQCRSFASGKSENGRVAADCEGIRGLESDELYWQLLGLIVFLGNMFILGLLIAP